MCGYVVFYGGKRAEIRAESLFAAKRKAVELFKVRPNKEHLVSVVLAERADGSEVVHSPCEL